MRYRNGCYYYWCRTGRLGGQLSAYSGTHSAYRFREGTDWGFLAFTALGLFYLNTPNWSNNLPGMEFNPDTPDAFGHRDQILSYLERYAASFDAPVRENAEVTALERRSNGKYLICVGDDSIESRVAVIASGGMSRARMPLLAHKLPGDINSLTAGTYRNARELPDGAVLVVGSAQSGCQIAEDLIAAGRRVYLCASRVGRIPRTYRGRDILAWWRDMGFWDVRVEDLEDPAMQYAALPQVSGTDGGHTVSFQSLARDGVTLLGRLLDVDGYTMKLQPELMKSIHFADEKSSAFKDAIDAFIQRAGITAPLPEPDPGEPSLPDLSGSDLLDRLELREAGITSVIWYTGFGAGRIINSSLCTYQSAGDRLVQMLSGNFIDYPVWMIASVCRV